MLNKASHAGTSHWDKKGTKAEATGLSAMFGLLLSICDDTWHEWYRVCVLGTVKFCYAHVLEKLLAFWGTKCNRCTKFVIHFIVHFSNNHAQ